MAWPCGTLCSSATITGAQDATFRNVTPTDIAWLCAGRAHSAHFVQRRHGVYPVHDIPHPAGCASGKAAQHQPRQRRLDNGKAARGVGKISFYMILLSCSAQNSMEMV